MALTRTVTGDISPKSVVASERGLVFAQNMMYRHTITVYDRNGDLVKTIPDTVNLADFGIPDHPGLVQGAPVEAAFSPDGKYAYVSNYSMYGEGFGPEGDDDCVPGDGYDSSFVYRIDVASLAVDQVIPVGSVPKYVAVTPRQPLPPRHQLVHLRPERRRHRDRQGGQAHRHGSVPARHRREPRLPHRVRRDHG